MINESANNESLAGAFSNLVNLIKKRIDKCLPCQVLEVSEDRTTIKVRPMIRVISKSDEQIQRGAIANLHIQTLGAGDVFMSFPVSAGDFGWIEASDRDISLFLQSLEESDPNTARKHSFSDARFIPDIMRDFTISDDDSTALVISTKDGAHKIAIDQSGIRHTSSENIDINGATITPSGDVVTASGVSLDDFKAEYDAHGHPYTWTGSAGSGTTGTPT